MGLEFVVIDAECCIASRHRLLQRHDQCRAKNVLVGQKPSYTHQTAFFLMLIWVLPVIYIFNSNFWWHVDAEIPVLGVSLSPCGCQQEETPKKGMAAMARKSTRISQMVRCGSSYKQYTYNNIILYIVYYIYIYYI